MSFASVASDVGNYDAIHTLICTHTYTPFARRRKYIDKQGSINIKICAIFGQEKRKADAKRSHTGILKGHCFKCQILVHH